MKKLFFVLISLSLIGCSIQEQTKKNSLTHDKIKGNVEFIEEATYDAIEKFGKIEKGNLSLTSVVVSKIYNEKGNNIEENVFNSYNGNLFYKSIINYDEKGCEIGNNRFKADGSLDMKFISKYDENG
jgi:hypothetical protein